MLDPDRMRDLDRRAAQNVKRLYDQRGKLKPDKPKKLSELERATADEIERGQMVLERRELDKRLKRLLLRRELSGDALGEAEELQARVDTLDEELCHFSRNDLKRFVRLWNKSRKTRYKLNG